MTLAITIAHNNKIKRINYRQGLSKEDFSYLLASHFNIKGSVVALADKDCNLYY